MNAVVLYVAAALTSLWGVAHLFATKRVVGGFGDLSPDNKRIITMEWIVEGVALISTAAFVAAVTAIDPLSPLRSTPWRSPRLSLWQWSPCSPASEWRSCPSICAQ